MFFSVITKILNWELSLRTELLFKDGMGVKDKKCLYYGGSLKNPIQFLRGDSRKTNT